MELTQAAAREKTGDHLAGPDLHVALVAQLDDWRALTTAAPAEARQLLMRLLAGQRIVFKPLQSGKGC